VTVRHLSDVLGLPFPEMTEKRSQTDQYKYDLYNATREISNRLAYAPVEDYAKNRGWNPKLLKEFSAGGIQNYGQVLEYLRGKYSDRLLIDIGYLTRNPNYPSIFADNRILFTIHDPLGRPVGFTARSINFKEGDTRKYVNSNNSLIFSKRNILYNIHRAKASLSKEESKVLYIVEGQADVLSLASKGLRSVVAISGTSFTDEHVQLVKDFPLVISCLDADVGGSKATKRSYTKYKEILQKELYLLQLPSGYDPDDFVQKKGLDAFLDLEPILPVEWEILNEYTIRKNLAAEYWLLEMTNISNLYHSKILKTLSVRSGIQIDQLQIRLNMLLAKKLEPFFMKGLVTGKIKLSIEE
jgi:DNA primase